MLETVRWVLCFVRIFLEKRQMILITKHTHISLWMKMKGWDYIVWIKWVTWLLFAKIRCCSTFSQFWQTTREQDEGSWWRGRHEFFYSMYHFFSLVQKHLKIHLPKPIYVPTILFFFFVCFYKLLGGKKIKLKMVNPENE